MTMRLSDGVYPFVDRLPPLSELRRIEAPAPLEALLRQVVRDNGAEIVSGEPVGLTCQFPGVAEAAFPVWQPAGGGRLHMLAPKAEAKGRP